MLLNTLFFIFAVLLISSNYASENVDIPGPVKLWSLDKHHSRRLRDTHRGRKLKHSSPMLKHLEDPLLFELPMDMFRNLEEKTTISFEVPKPKMARFSARTARGTEESEEMEVLSCELNVGVPGIPQETIDKYPTLKFFSCNPGPLQEFHIYGDTSSPESMSANLFLDDGRMFYIDSMFKESEVYVISEAKEYRSEVHRSGAKLPNFIPADGTEMERHPHEDSHKEERRLRKNSPRKLQTSTNAFRFTFAAAVNFQVLEERNFNIQQMISLLTSILSRTNGILAREVGVFLQFPNGFDDFICQNEQQTGCNVFENNRNDRTVTEEFFTAVLGANNLGNIHMGHVIHDSGSGGAARLSTVCDDSFASRARAASDFAAFAFGNNVDAIAVNMFAHEIGHQLGIEHTWRDCINFQNELSDDMGTEPGGGTSLMAYNGVCGANTNRANTGDAYLTNLAQQLARVEIERIATCGTEVNINRNIATLTVPGRCEVPVGNNFLLVGGTTTSNNGFFSWDRLDPGFEDLDDLASGMFRSFPPKRNIRERFFPNLNFQNFISFDQYEKLPDIQRTMNFRFTERDLFQAQPDANSFSSSIVGDFVFADTRVDFVGGQTLRLNEPSNGVTLPINKGFFVDWRPGATTGLSNDGRVQILFAQHSMTAHTASTDGFRFDESTELQDLDWQVIGVQDLAVGRACVQIPIGVQNFDPGLKANLMVRVNTNQDENAAVDDDFACYVTVLATELTLEDEDPTIPEACDPQVIIQQAPDENNNAGGGGGGGAVGAVLAIFILAAVVALMYASYREKKKSDSYIPNFKEIGRDIGTSLSSMRFKPNIDLKSMSESLPSLRFKPNVNFKSISSSFSSMRFKKQAVKEENLDSFLFEEAASSTRKEPAMHTPPQSQSHVKKKKSLRAESEAGSVKINSETGSVKKKSFRSEPKAQKVPFMVRKKKSLRRSAARNTSLTTYGKKGRKSGKRAQMLADQMDPEEENAALRARLKRTLGNTYEQAEENQSQKQPSRKFKENKSSNFTKSKNAMKGGIALGRKMRKKAFQRMSNPSSEDDDSVAVSEGPRMMFTTPSTQPPTPQNSTAPVPRQNSKPSLFTFAGPSYFNSSTPSQSKPSPKPPTSPTPSNSWSKPSPRPPKSPAPSSSQNRPSPRPPPTKAAPKPPSFNNSSRRFGGQTGGSSFRTNPRPPTSTTPSQSSGQPSWVEKARKRREERLKREKEEKEKAEQDSQNNNEPRGPSNSVSNLRSRFESSKKKPNWGS